jgi:hypothetical protein
MTNFNATACEHRPVNIIVTDLVWVYEKLLFRKTRFVARDYMNYSL